MNIRVKVREEVKVCREEESVVMMVARRERGRGRQ